MSNLIKALWNGNLSPILNFSKHNEEIKSLEKLISKNYEKLEVKLKKDQKELLKKYSCCIDEYTVLIVEQAFYEGFSIGSGITNEALSCANEYSL